MCALEAVTDWPASIGTDWLLLYLPAHMLWDRDKAAPGFTVLRHAMTEPLQGCLGLCIWFQFGKPLYLCQLLFCHSRKIHKKQLVRIICWQILRHFTGSYKDFDLHNCPQITCPTVEEACHSQQIYLCAAPSLFVLKLTSESKKWITNTRLCKTPPNLTHASALLCFMFQGAKLHFYTRTQGHLLLTRPRAIYSALQLESNVEVSEGGHCTVQVLAPISR